MWLEIDNKDEEEFFNYLDLTIPIKIYRPCISSFNGCERTLKYFVSSEKRLKNLIYYIDEKYHYGYDEHYNIFSLIEDVQPYIGNKSIIKSNVFPMDFVINNFKFFSADNVGILKELKKLNVSQNYINERYREIID